uniref:Putative secreted protein n=1 Tax=Ixodes scapularis TaxID=6945 RepID=A0A4D5RX11_IXOSC
MGLVTIGVMWIFTQRVVGQPFQSCDNSLAVDEQFSQCSTTASLGSLTCTMRSSDTRPHIGTMIIQIETGRGGD